MKKLKAALSSLFSFLGVIAVVLLTLTAWANKPRGIRISLDEHN